MKHIHKLVLSVFVCELVGISGAIFTSPAIPSWYATLNKPLFSPPNWVFGPVWTLLYAMMGVAFYLIWIQGWKKKSVRQAGQVFLAQLVVNWLWSPAFFGLQSPALGLVVIFALWGLLVLTIQRFFKVSKPAAYLLVPYLLWVSFASLLNIAIFWLN